MVPTSSISKMFDIIKNESNLKLYSTEQLLEFLHSFQNEDSCYCAFEPVVDRFDMEKIIMIENALIDELLERGISCSRRKFSKTEE